MHPSSVIVSQRTNQQAVPFHHFILPPFLSERRRCATRTTESSRERGERGRAKGREREGGDQRKSESFEDFRSFIPSWLFVRSLAARWRPLSPDPTPPDPLAAAAGPCAPEQVEGRVSVHGEQVNVGFREGALTF